LQSFGVCAPTGVPAATKSTMQDPPTQENVWQVLFAPQSVSEEHWGMPPELALDGDPPPMPVPEEVIEPPGPVIPPVAPAPPEPPGPLVSL
jgi:hypothetical protein